ncbi:hypothetical protein TNCV_1806821 [Trichonephila clavipes]|nr:hypothetical protein TNCV_1806821 [Trichonephila clavipes]
MKQKQTKNKRSGSARARSDQWTGYAKQIKKYLGRSMDSMAGEAVSLHSLLANRNCKIYRQNFEADDFPSGAVDLFKGVGTRHPFRWGKETHSPNSICCKQQQGRCKNYSCNLRDRRPPITPSDGRSPVPKVTTAVCTFALFTGNGFLRNFGVPQAWERVTLFGGVKRRIHQIPFVVNNNRADVKITVAILGTGDLPSLLVMGGRRSPKLQRQFVHLPCLQETDF